MYSRFIVVNVCASNWVGLERSPDPDACSEKALGEPMAEALGALGAADRYG
jgi:hypothetical protein